MTKDEEKRRAAERAIAYVEEGSVVGVGTGSTVAHFIDALARIKDRIEGAVSSSEQSTRQLRGHGIAVLDLNATGDLGVYIDGADECDPHKRLIKGGGAALTRDKIIASACRKVLWLIDSSKRVDVLGRFALPVEVIDMARERIVRRFADIGGRAVLRQSVLTDNGHPLLDVHGLHITDPLALEAEINQWPGVVAVGIFARHRARVCLLGTPEGVKRLEYA